MTKELNQEKKKETTDEIRLVGQSLAEEDGENV